MTTGQGLRSSVFSLFPAQDLEQFGEESRPLEERFAMLLGMFLHASQTIEVLKRDIERMQARDVAIETIATEGGGSVVGDASWSGPPLSIENGGTDADNVLDARTNLGLGTMAQQNASAVAITGGTFEGSSVEVSSTLNLLHNSVLAIKDSGGSTIAEMNRDTDSLAEIVCQPGINFSFRMSDDGSDLGTFGVNVGGTDWLSINRTGSIDIKIGDTGVPTVTNIDGHAIIGTGTRNVGFFGASGTTKQTVTGSRGGNAALASLLTALANYGLITNSTT